MSLLAATSMLSACSVTVTENQPSAEPSSASAAPTDFASDYYDFCALEARGSLDFLSMLGPDAADAIAEGIAQSIEQQGVTGQDADACTKGWIDALAEAGVTYDPATGTMTGEFTATPTP